MKYFVELEGREYVVDIDPDGIRIDDEPVKVDLAPGAGTRHWHLLLDHVSYTLRAERAAERGSWEIELGGRRHLVLALDERRRAIRRLSGPAAGGSGPYEVVAPMPGLVIAVEVSADEAVTSGQGLIVIEAMKMENEVKAKTAGQVSDIKVAEGQAVDKGETLLVIEPDGRRA